MAKKQYAQPRWDASRKHWKLNVRNNGKRKSFYSSNPSSRGAAECRRKAEEWISSIDQADDEQLKKMRLGEAWAGYSDDYKEKNKLTSWNQLNSRYSSHLQPYDLNIMSEMRKRDWQKIIDDAYKGGAKSLATLKGIATTIRGFCIWCAGKGIIEDEQVPVHFDFPIKATTKAKGILQPDDWAKLFSKEAEDDFYIFVFRFLATTGLRRGELPPLQTFRDYDGAGIHIRESLSHEHIMTDGKTAQANRYLALSAIAKEQIINHQRQAGVGKYLFMSPEGGIISPRVIGNHWRIWRENHGIEITLHELRHTYISYSRLKTGIGLEDLKKLYGHSKNMNTDSVYVHEILKSPEEILAERKAAQQQAMEIGDIFEGLISG